MVSFAAGVLAVSERAGAFGLKSQIHINNHEKNVFPTACLPTSAGSLLSGLSQHHGLSLKKIWHESDHGTSYLIATCGQS